MEQYELKPLTLDLFRRIVEAYPDGGGLPGIALQAYLPETATDLAVLITYARSGRRRIGIRLVKGAYWDYETAIAEQRRWPLPVFPDKPATDTEYEHLTAMLFENVDAVYPTIAGHNLRSIAHAIALAQMRGLHVDGLTPEVLYSSPRIAAVGRVFGPIPGGFCARTQLS